MPPSSTLSDSLPGAFAVARRPSFRAVHFHHRRLSLVLSPQRDEVFDDRLSMIVGGCVADRAA
jgi:hypothetical protein